jgi:hypothetical protein
MESPSIVRTTLSFFTVKKQREADRKRNWKPQHLYGATEKTLSLSATGDRGFKCSDIESGSTGNNSPQETNTIQ